MIHTDISNSNLELQTLKEVLFKMLICSPETTTTLLISYTPVQKKKFKVKKKVKKKIKYEDNSEKKNQVLIGRLKNK